MFLCLVLPVIIYGKTININQNTNQSVQNDDVKFIVDTSASSAQWQPGVSSIDRSDQKLLKFDTEGLNLYSIKGKINIFDSDVITIEKYGTFGGTQAQKQMLENLKQEKSDNSTLTGLNISIKAFLLLKYFYMNEYKYLDALEYQYSSYKFYGLAVNSVKTYFWYGKTNEGTIKKDFFPLSTDSKIKFYTDFKEHRLYLLELTDLFQSVPIDSIKAGVYSTNWLRPTFLKQYNQDQVPIIHFTEMTSEGIVLNFSQKIFNSLNLSFILNYGFDNYINYSSNSLKVDYVSYNVHLGYKHLIYKGSNYELFTNLEAFMSKKYLSADSVDLNNEDVKGALLGVSIVF